MQVSAGNRKNSYCVKSAGSILLKIELDCVVWYGIDCSVGNRLPSQNRIDKEKTKRYTYARRKIRLIEGNAKCRCLKKLTCKGTLRQVFIRVYRPEIANFLRTFSHVDIFNPAP